MNYLLKPIFMTVWCLVLGACAKNPTLVERHESSSTIQGSYSVELFEEFCRESVNYSTGMLEPYPMSSESSHLLDEYLKSASAANPDLLSTRESLHFWVNTRNALAVKAGQSTAKQAKGNSTITLGGASYTVAKLDQLINERYPLAIERGLLGNGTTTPIPIKPLTLKTDLEFLGLQ